MAEVADVSTLSPSELLATGRRHLAVRDYSAAVSTLSKACEALIAEHGETADQCAEANLWYGKALLGLSREESGVFGILGNDNADAEDGDNEEQEENGENGEDETNEAEAGLENGETANGDTEKTEAEPTTMEEESGPSTTKEGQPGTSNGEAADESMLNLDDDEEEECDNLQLAWETLDLARSILQRRVERGDAGARALLADAHLALGEVALESETYDKAVADMLSCLEIQKELYQSDNRPIAETHYQIGLANSLASNFEDAITHFKNAANILETRIKTLEAPNALEDPAVKKYMLEDPFFSLEGEIKEIKEVLPEIQEKIQDMMEYKTETLKRVRETLCPSNGEGSSSSQLTSGSGSSGSTATDPKPAASNISHLIKRKRKASDAEETSAPKRVNT